MRDEIKIVAPTLYVERASIAHDVFARRRRWRRSCVCVVRLVYLNARGKAVRVVEGDLVCGVPADVDEAGGNACYGGRDR